MSTHNEQQPAAAQEVAGWQVFNSVVGAWQDASKSHYESRKAHYPEEARELYAAPVTAAPADNLHAHLLHMLGAKDHEDAGRIIGELHAATMRTPEAPGIDLRQFRDAVVAWSDKAYEESHNPEHPTIQQADRLLALIDAGQSNCWPEGSYAERVERLMGMSRGEREAIGSRPVASPKGGSDARDAARYRWLREFAVNGSIGIPFHGWLNCDEPASEWDSAIDAAMQAGDAEVQP